MIIDQRKYVMRTLLLICMWGLALRGSDLTAQLSEFETTRYVPAETIAAVTINMRTIIEQMNLEDPLVRKFLDVGEEKGGMDYSKLNRILVMFSPRDEEHTAFGPPAAMLIQFNEPFDYREFMEHNASDYLDFEIEDYEGHEIHVGRFTYEGAAGDGPGYFFPEDDTIVQGTRKVIQQMIDGETADSPGMELVNNLDHDAEIHVVVEDGSQIAEMLGLPPGLNDLGVNELAEGLRRLEFIASYDQQPPVQLTIEMNTVDQANQVIGLINAGRVAAPGALDGMEDGLDEQAERGGPELQDEAIQVLRDLIVLGNSALREMKIERNEATIRITLGQIEGLEKLPQLFGQAMGAMMLGTEAMLAEEGQLELTVPAPAEIDD